jgi:glycosyltransferase involved in cell wall biosynthesis
MSLSAIIIAKNEAHHIGDCVASLRWADDVIVCDTGSSDDTATLAQQAGARVILHHPFENFAYTRNVALDTATNADWVFFVDTDERATPELAAEVQGIVASDLAPVGYWVPQLHFWTSHTARGLLPRLPDAPAASRPRAL